VEFTRRHFIGLGITSLAGLASLAVVDVMSRRAGRPGLADVATLFTDAELFSAAQIGRAWLRAHPSEVSREELAALLSPLPAEVRSARSLESPVVRAWLKPRQSSDFAAKRILQLEGWWLSETEARYCAFLSLA
jgi:hypothetical protein